DELRRRDVAIEPHDRARHLPARVLGVQGVEGRVGIAGEVGHTHPELELTFPRSEADHGPAQLVALIQPVTTPPTSQPLVGLGSRAWRRWAGTPPLFRSSVIEVAISPSAACALKTGSPPWSRSRSRGSGPRRSSEASEIPPTADDPIANVYIDRE